MEGKLKKHSIFLIVTVCWAVSLIFRMQYVEKTPPVNNVAHIFMLQTIQVWQHEGPMKSHCAQKHTFHNNGDKFITYYKRYMDNKGNNYYVSHPSLSQCFVWLFTGFGKFPVNNATLMWLAMFLQLITTCVLVCFVHLLTQNHSRFFIQIIAALIYLFHPVLLYMNTFHFFAETLGQTMFIVTGFLILKYIKMDFKNSRWGLVLLFVASFLFVSSEWLGIIFILSMGLMYLMQFRRSQILLKPLIALSAGGLLAIMTFIIQHSTLQDFITLARALWIRFLERSGFFGNEYTDLGYSYSNPETYLLFAGKILNLFEGTGFLLIILLIFMFVNRNKLNFHFDNNNRLIINVMLFSCIFYTLIFFSATAIHYVYIAKWIVPLILISVISLQILFVLLRRSFVKVFSLLLIISLVIWSVIIFERKSVLMVKPDKTLMQYAKYISRESEKELPVFCKPLHGYSDYTVIWLSFASGRNLKYYESQDDVCRKQLPAPEKYLYFSYDGKMFSKIQGNCTQQ